MCCRCWRPSAVTSERGGRVSAVDWFHATAVYRARSSKESPRGVWSPRQCKEQTPWSRSKESQRRAADSQDNHAIMKRRLVGWALALGCLISTATPRETFLCIDEKTEVPVFDQPHTAMKQKTRTWHHTSLSQKAAIFHSGAGAGVQETTTSPVFMGRLFLPPSLGTRKQTPIKMQKGLSKGRNTAPFFTKHLKLQPNPFQLFYNQGEGGFCCLVSFWLSKS